MSCTRASRFLDAKGIEAKQVVPASRKLARKEALELAREASRVIVAKGKKISEFAGGKVGNDVIAAMLGPTGNLRAPTIRKGRTVVVGFHPEVFEEIFG
jgi:NADPH-dependent glutamate synthase beta subunit-like oxidoreductase